jgi:hypothetical protein
MSDERDRDAGYPKVRSAPVRGSSIADYESTDKPRVPGPPAPPTCSGCDRVVGFDGRGHSPDCFVPARLNQLHAIKGIIERAISSYPLPSASWEAAKAIQARFLLDSVEPE